MEQNNIQSKSIRNLFRKKVNHNAAEYNITTNAKFQNSRQFITLPKKWGKIHTTKWAIGHDGAIIWVSKLKIIYSFRSLTILGHLLFELVISKENVISWRGVENIFWSQGFLIRSASHKPLTEQTKQRRVYNWPM